MEREPDARQKSVSNMVRAIRRVLEENLPSIYLYGSSVLDDFRLGWSDIDLLVLTKKRITQEQAEELVTLRQKLLEGEPGNPYYRSFEGGMLTLDAFLSKEPDRVVYWGTSGQRIAEAYSFDSFSMAELLQNGRLLYGQDIRGQLKMPDYPMLCAAVRRHYGTIRSYGGEGGRSLYPFGWLLDIARGLYTLRTGAVASKTAAGQWALDNGLCPVPDALETALRVRRNPAAYRDDSAVWDYAQTLGDKIQRFADVLEKELEAAGVGEC